MAGESACPTTDARNYRRYAMEQGFYRSLKQKLEECPSLEKIFGAVLVMLGYLSDPQADYAAAFRKLKSRGVEKAYVYPAGYFNFNGTDELYPGYRSDYKFISRAGQPVCGYADSPPRGWLQVAKLAGGQGLVALQPRRPRAGDVPAGGSQAAREVHRRAF